MNDSREAVSLAGEAYVVPAGTHPARRIAHRQGHLAPQGRHGTRHEHAAGIGGIAAAGI